MIFMMDASSSSLKLDKVDDDMRSILPLQKMVGKRRRLVAGIPKQQAVSDIGPGDFSILVRDDAGVSNSAWKGLGSDPQHEEENRPARDISSDVTSSNRRTPQS
jgi:hypothetical protein